MKTNAKTLERVARMPFSEVYPHYVTKVERKGRTRAELHEVITWLTGYSEADIDELLKNDTPFDAFFAECTLHKNAALITGVICGVRVEEIEEPLMRQLRYLDKLVDELAKGKAMEKILRT